MSAPYRIVSPAVVARREAAARRHDRPGSAAAAAPVTAAPPTVTTKEQFEFFLEKLTKLLPGEAISLYLVGSGLIPSEQKVGLLVWSVICLIGVVLLRIFGTRDPKKKLAVDWWHVVISAVSFIIWVYTLGGPFAAYGVHISWIGSLAVLAWTFFLPIFYNGPANG